MNTLQIVAIIVSSLCLVASFILIGLNISDLIKITKYLKENK